MDGDGQVVEAAATNGDKNSAESHAAGTSTAAYNRVYAGDDGTDTRDLGDDKEVEEVTDMFAGLAKKVRSLFTPSPHSANSH